MPMQSGTSIKSISLRNWQDINISEKATTHKRENYWTYQYPVLFKHHIWFLAKSTRPNNFTSCMLLITCWSIRSAQKVNLNPYKQMHIIHNTEGIDHLSKNTARASKSLTLFNLACKYVQGCSNWSMRFNELELNRKWEREREIIIKKKNAYIPK